MAAHPPSVKSSWLPKASQALRSALANMVTDAVAARGRGMKGFRDATVEGLHPTTNVGRGPTKGNRA